ncbi:hypothetical protein [Shewanella psychromarinicola]|uniref:Cytochrome P460 domain-containing protein n=1 Tax=Shewanella psychromarinicola TaxID=2487742 RepID=A0A3N4EB46_9GAMM|nr:hypothetical protein [Shewanella psychromarinicola]AZG35467.1 hypothetical protein EGC80_11455 [Shewanella psychromarinicola]MCL1084124.1 hypothetical protein [Shewanella psychromarinicola]RPA31201.1 hypothetical protein EGC77_14700 [Shewanella psychromarinicola]
MRLVNASILCIMLLTCSQALAGDISTVIPDFRCIRDMVPIRHFYVDNIIGAEELQLTVKAANNPLGEMYPVGSIIQLVPTEVMVKRDKGFSPVTNDWEFFELDVSSKGSKILTRGFVDVKNKFGGNCFACHIKADPQWDFVCETGHGCDPLPLTHVMTRAIQKVDPRCTKMETLTTEESAALAELNVLMGGGVDM